MFTPELPINAILPELRQGLAEKRTALLAAPPGSGKTTGIPLALLTEPWLGQRKILMLEPRRLAARLAAARMASLLAEPVGRTVGYQVRLERKISSATRIEVLTEGILTRRLQSDPELAEVGLVIFDEFHERTLHADLALTLCLEVLANLRPDLRLLVMSATLAVEAIAAILKEPAVIIGSGQSFPVALKYVEPLSDIRGQGISDYHFSPVRVAASTAAGIRLALRQEQGDVLAFLPGAGEIRRTAELLAAGATDAVIRPLFGDLSPAAQELALFPDPQQRRRVVLATSIAETSLTIEGISTVVDSGWSRRPRFHQGSGLSRLETVRVSQAAATQRSGRAGRLGPGVCYRLWREGLQSTLQAHHPPEIMDADLAPLVLELALWGVREPAALIWPDLPPAGNFARGRELLQSLGALDRQGRITPEGKKMAGLPLHPRLASMLLHGKALGLGRLAADLAAILTEPDLLKKSRGPRPADLEIRLHLLHVWRRGANKQLLTMAGDPAACARVEQTAQNCLRLLAGIRQHDEHEPEDLGTLLTWAYPDRIAQRRANSREQYLLASGRGARLPAGDSLAGIDYLVAPEMDHGHKEGRIFLAAALSPAALHRCHSHLFAITETVQWDEKLAGVTARREVRIGELVLESSPAVGSPEKIRAVMIQAIQQQGLEILPWNQAARDLQARVISLRQWQGQEEWPDLSDANLLASLAQWLQPHLNRISRVEQLTRLDLNAILAHLLDWRQQGRLEEEAPARITVPSGSKVRLEYAPTGPPLLKVRLQEMFGLADTPRICRGRIKVLLHLLSPAGRPIQVTDDLRGFWDRTYPEVKKELKGRYPRHHWPDDPWSARPTARAKPRTKK